MTDGMAVALVAAPLSVAGALVMRWFELRSRSASWNREDHLRFVHDKRQAYAEFLTECNWLYVYKSKLGDDDFRRFSVAAMTVILLAPKALVSPAQDLQNLTLAVARKSDPSQVEKWRRQLAAFADAARKDLEIDP